MNETPDVIIIGAGIIGCAAAFELSKAGYQTLNVDKHGQPGYGSTGNSCAVIRLTYSTYDGIALAFECFRYWKAWADYLETSDSKGLIRFANEGTIIVRSPDSRYERMMRLFDEIGVGYDLWDADTFKEKLPFMTNGSFFPPARLDDDRFWEEPDEPIQGALFVHEGGYVNDPQLATHNLMVAAGAKGARFRFNSEVTAIRRASGRVQGVTLADGSELDAPIVINISGPHSGRINRMAGVESEMKIKTRPMRHEVHLAPNPAGINPADYISHFSDDDAGVYFRPETGDSLLIGSKDPACDPREWIEDPDNFNREVTREQWQNQLLRMAKRMPGLPIPSTPRGIVDLYDVSDDWIPIYDKSSLPGFYMAVGTSGNQFKTAPPVGHMLARIIDRVENGHDHDNDPVRYKAVYSGLEIDCGFYSRLREINRESSFTVNG